MASSLCSFELLLGIGQETAKQLVQMGATVFVAGRTEEQTQSLAEELGAIALPGELNLASLESISAFKKACKEDLATIDVVVANAGVGMVPNRAKTDDGHEIHFGVNHLGHFALLKARSFKFTPPPPPPPPLGSVHNGIARGKFPPHSYQRSVCVTHARAVGGLFACTQRDAAVALSLI